MSAIPRELTAADPDDLVSSYAPLVVVIAATRAERERLVVSLPRDIRVLVAATPERAQALIEAAAVIDACPSGPMTFDPELRDVCFLGRRLRLTPLEFKTLTVLSSDAHQVWSLAELTRSVWATGYVGDGAQVRSVIKRLRRKLAEAGAPLVIETIRGTGFRAVPLVDS